jgi:hypothetical protein
LSSCRSKRLAAQCISAAAPITPAVLCKVHHTPSVTGLL